VASRLVERDPKLWLSRSWTTRARRPGEAADAYRFVDRVEFEKHIAGDGFLEWAEFLGNLYGTPHPVPPPGQDVLLEIDLQGAAQVRARDPHALIVLLLPPSPEVQATRMRARGDDEAEIRRRLEKGAREEQEGRRLTPHVVVNDDVDRAVGEVAGIVEAQRTAAPAPPGARPNRGA